MKRILFVLFILITLFSCKEKTKVISEKEENPIPNFSNVELDKVFKNKALSQKELDSLHSIIQSYYQTTWEEGNLWGGLLVAKGNQIIFENYRGYTQENHQNPITKNTSLHVASVSKTLTAMAILKLVEANKIQLNSKVDDFLYGFPYKNVTIKSLLTHRSGLPKYEHFTAFIPQYSKEMQKEFLTNEDVFNLLIEHHPPVVRSVNEGFMYNNLNFALLALVIEKVTGLSYPEAMKKIVFEPLKMKNTYVFQAKDLKNMPKTFYQKGEVPHPLDRFDLIYGDKNIYTTPRDLFNFSIAMFSDDFLKKELKSKIFLPYSNEKEGINNYGLGFRMKIFDENTKLTYHNGWWHGTNSVFVHQLKSKVTIIAIGNKFSRGVYSAMTIASLFENLPFETKTEENSEESENKNLETKELKTDKVNDSIKVESVE